MKNMFYIIGLLCMYLLLAPSQGEKISNNTAVAGYEAVMKEKNPQSDMQHRIEIISNELRNSNCQIPRRNIQSTNYSHFSNILKNTIRTTQESRIKETGQLHKTSEYFTYCQTINYSALLRRMGYHVYALRKIII